MHRRERSRFINKGGMCANLEKEEKEQEEDDNDNNDVQKLGHCSGVFHHL